MAGHCGQLSFFCVPSLANGIPQRAHIKVHRVRFEVIFEAIALGGQPSTFVDHIERPRRLAQIDACPQRLVAQ